MQECEFLVAGAENVGTEGESQKTFGQLRAGMSDFKRQSLAERLEAFQIEVDEVDSARPLSGRWQAAQEWLDANPHAENLDENRGIASVKLERQNVLSWPLF